MDQIRSFDAETPAGPGSAAGKRRAVAGLLGFRVAFGVAMAAAPQRFVRPWLGRTDDPLDVAVRTLAAREVLVHGMALAVLLRGGDVRPWLAVSAAGDLSDVALTYASRSGLPRGSAPMTAIAAGGSAALTTTVLSRL